LSGPETTTDAAGDFLVRIPSIPRGDAGNQSKLFAVVTKEGYAGSDTPRMPLIPGDDGSHHLTFAITLKPGASLTGKVIGPDGKPLEGVWIEPGDSYAARSAFTRTDEEGRFTVRNLPRGMVRLSFSYGDLTAVSTKYFADIDGGKDHDVEIQLHPMDELLAESKAKQANKPKPLAVGQIAPEWDVRDWTDGKPRTLADYRGKIVFLDFWGMWCGPCVSQLPVLEKLREKYEPRGVVFVSIHTAGEKADRIRRFLEFSKSTLVSAVDIGVGRDVNGTTADRYGIRGYPTVVLIDRAGKIAFRSDDRSQFPKVGAIMKELGIDPKTGTEAQSHQLIETIFDREIETLLKRP
jgi:thiol-disulfide isomerase/thioredoxin